MADAAETTSFADRINNTLTPVSDFVSSIIFYSVDFFGVSLPLVVVWLIAAALIITLSLSFINLRGFRHGWHLIFNPKEHQMMMIQPLILQHKHTQQSTSQHKV